MLRLLGLAFAAGPQWVFEAGSAAEPAWGGVSWGADCLHAFKVLDLMSGSLHEV